MNQPMYCLTHEAWACPELMDYVPDECLFVTSEPPVLPANWEELVTPPSPEEMEQMDASADELQLQFFEEIIE